MTTPKNPTPAPALGIRTDPPVWSANSPDLATLISEAVDHAVAATDPVSIGDHGLSFLVPDGFKLERVDVRDLSDPQLPHHRAGLFRFVTIGSVAKYVDRYKTGDTLAYITDVTGRGPATLTGDLPVASYVLDDYPASGTAHREHIAQVVLRPTPAARRWGRVLTAGTIDQETLLDLVVDGIREIAAPDAASLRDLIADLHAIRTTSARSVIRTGGAATVEVAENVTLHGGTGNTITIPELITVTFRPFAGVPTHVAFDIRVKPKVGRDDRVTFTLEAPDLDDQITQVLFVVADQLETQTGIAPMWIP